jgi:UDP-glucose 4-epimerase
MTISDHNCYGEIFNVGSGRNHSVLELAAMISNDTKMIEPRRGEAYITLANTVKIQNVFGWKATKHIEDYIKESLTGHTK